MATHFSFLLPLSEEASILATSILDTLPDDADLSALSEPGLVVRSRFLEVIEDDGAYFHVNIVSKGLHISHLDDMGQPDHAAAFCQILLDVLSLNEVIGFEVAYACDDPGDPCDTSSHNRDAIGGAIYVVSSHGVSVLSTQELLKDALSVAKSGISSL